MKAEPSAFMVEPEFMGLDLEGQKTLCLPVVASEYGDLTPGSVLVTRHRGSFIRPCPATPRYNCCGLNIIHVGQGCDIGCAYCALAAYLKSEAIVFFGNFPTEGLAELAGHLDRERALNANPLAVPAMDPAMDPAANPAASPARGEDRGVAQAPRSHRYCTGEFTDSLL
ncbi:MAG: hypothetical protein LBJ61_04565, partial [Deltaproteobacteria bacterium]|nr:hypothetical protein [Deltaproteobacteria bacterium]